MLLPSTPTLLRTRSLLGPRALTRLEVAHQGRQRVALLDDVDEAGDDLRRPPRTVCVPFIEVSQP
jgi:hypothetical protein